MGDTHNGKAVNCRQMFTEKSSTRIFAPPGGHSSFSLGGGGYDQSTIRRNPPPGKSKYGHGGDALDDLVSSIPGLDGRRSIPAQAQFSKGIPGLERSNSSNGYASQLQDQIDAKRRIDQENDHRYNASYGSSSFSSNSYSGSSDSRHSQPRQQEDNSYAAQLKEQIETKRRMDKEAENKYNSSYGQPSYPSNARQHGSYESKSRSAPTGRRGQNPSGGQSSFSLGW